MSRRIEVELTSTRDDGTWTWRAAGAKQPKGVLDGALLYPGAKVGDVVRAEADFEIDGITIVSITPPKAEERKEPERIEVIGTRRDQPGVTSSLVPKSDRRRDRGDRPERGDRGPRREGPPRGERGDRPRGEGGERGGPSRDRRDRPERPPRERAERPERGERPARAPRPERPERPAPPKPKRLNPANVHRAAVLDSLPPEQRPIAEQVLRGGIPAVRQAVEQQNAARKEGEPEVKADPFIAIAEELLPRLKTADWRDKAEAAVKDVDEIALRDLRSVVAGADAAARDDETRELARTLREALERRVVKQRDEWVAEIGSNLDEGRVVRALRLSGRPPDPGSRFPAELAARLTEAAGAALAPDISADRWMTVLDAVASSPVRRQVKPAGLPAEPGEPLLQAAKQASGRVPALAAMLGIEMPPPPGPPRAVPPRGPRPPRPPKPPRPAAPPAPAAPTSKAAVEPPAAEAPPAEAPAPEPTNEPTPKAVVEPAAPQSPAPAAEAPPAEAPAPEPTPEAEAPEAAVEPGAPESPAPAAEAPPAEDPEAPAPEPTPEAKSPEAVVEPGAPESPAPAAEVPPAEVPPAEAPAPESPAPEPTPEAIVEHALAPEPEAETPAEHEVSATEATLAAAEAMDEEPAASPDAEPSGS